MNPKLKTLLDLWPQIVAGYHKSSDHVWQFVGEFNVLSGEINWHLKHDGYCHSSLEFGPFFSFEALQNWSGETLREYMLKTCHDELNHCEGGKYFLVGDDPEMPKQHWEQLIVKLENL